MDQTSRCCTERAAGAKIGQSSGITKQEHRKQPACFVDQGGGGQCSPLLQRQRLVGKPTTTLELEQPQFVWGCFPCAKSGNRANFFKTHKMSRPLRWEAANLAKSI